MLLVGLTGGIGTGKSTVARMLEKRGAVVFDADVLARQAVAPGTPGFDQVVDRFGPNVLAPGGGLDREALASIVFSDPAARRDLEGIVHPEVRRMFAEGCEEYRDSDRVVVFSAPLLVETGMHTAFDLLIVVSAPVAIQIERLMRDRGMAERDVRARIAAQLPLEAKAEVADILVDNEGTLEDLERRVDRVWRDLDAQARAGAR
ncbi:MAG TPA: dephospho-CoA kinase [Actinomycetota bacterium]|nr:dephospho-CoA kinase [Actinomycetota bacterium]